MSAYRITSVEIGEGVVVVTLASGRRLSQAWGPELAQATPADRLAWELVDDGCSVHWPRVFGDARHPFIRLHELFWDDRVDAALARLAAVGHDVTKLEDDDHDVVVLFRLEADVYNGGFMQFLCNWGDPTVQRAIRVLEAIGASRTHAIVKRMRGILDRLEDDPSVTSLWGLYPAMTAAEHAEMGELDRAFWADPDDLRRRLAAERYVG